MQTEPLTAAQVRRYLAVLGVDREATGLAALRRLVRAHLVRVPFDTVSKLWYLSRDGLRDVADVEREIGIPARIVAEAIAGIESFRSVYG